MKLAVTYEDGLIFQHFGHAKQFKIYEIENGELIGSEIVDAEGSGHGELTNFLAERDVEMLICGGVGAGAFNALNEAGIHVYAGVGGGADEAVMTLLEGIRGFESKITCSGHDYDGGCGGHDGECGGSCGDCGCTGGCH